MGKITISDLYYFGFHVNSFASFFAAYMFWASVLFLPVAVVGALIAKYYDGGEGLTFKSNNVVVIIFAHIAEEILGLFLTPFWFLVDFFKKRLDDGGKVIDYIAYVVELIFIAVGVIVL